MTLDQFAEYYHQEILSRCDNQVELREESFSEIAFDDLAEANETNDVETCIGRWQGKRGVPAARVNGCSFAGDGATLDLFVCRYHGTGEVRSTPAGEVSEYLKHLRGFLQRSIGGFYKELEESDVVFDVARRIYEQRNVFSTARLFLVTDGLAKLDRVSLPSDPVEGVDVKYFLWDIEKLWQFHTSGRAREVVSLNFEDPIPCLGIADGQDEYETYLMFMPGQLLAQIYGEHGPRLLERNVRSFLQLRGKINKGIHETISSEPNRFLAYNNGLSVTASEVGIEEVAEGQFLLREAKDFQIVNGGQTTASIYHAWKKNRCDISQVAVQVKLTVAKDPEQLTELVPLISLYANSQNKVNTADFSANGPFHRQLEELSRTVWAPATGGLERGTRWYYERARGSYLDEKSRIASKAQIKKWEAAHPLDQKFTKTDLAKFENAWNELPHWVALGGEKNFGRWTSNCEEYGWPAVNEVYFQRLVAKAILFRQTERIVTAQGLTGYRNCIVAYSISWLVRQCEGRLPLDKIWKAQELPQAVAEALDVIAYAARNYLTSPPEGKNISEWSKKSECWEGFKNVVVKLPEKLKEELVAEAYKPTVDPTTVQQLSGDHKAILEQVSAEYWFGLAKWAKEHGFLQAWQRKMAFDFGRLTARGKDLSHKQAVQAIKIMAAAKDLGYSVKQTETLEQSTA